MELIVNTGNTLNVDWDAFSSKVGRRPDQLMFYNGWADQFMFGGQQTSCNYFNAVAQIVWQPTVSPAVIMGGTWDAYINGAANTMRTWNKRTVIRLMHEFNGTWQPYGPQACTPTEFINAWHYIVDKFDAIGTPKVEWAWTPNTWSTTGTIVDPTSRYPGDNYVDWVGADSYCTTLNPAWVPLGQIFHTNAYTDVDCYNVLTSMAPTKPFMIGETSCGDNVRGSKAAWFADWVNILKYYPACESIGIFDRYKIAQGENDFRIDSAAGVADPNILSAFRTAVNSQPFAQRRGRSRVRVQRT